MPGGTRGIANTPFAPTTATVSPTPKPPKLWNSPTSKPAADRPDSVVTRPFTSTGVTGTSAIVALALACADAVTAVALEASTVDG